MDELSLQELGKGWWVLPLYMAFHAWREWLHHKRLMRMLELQQQQQRAITEAHEALERVPRMSSDDAIWPWNAIEKARGVLTGSLPPKKGPK